MGNLTSLLRSPFSSTAETTALSDRPLIAVLGASGSQGGSVAKYLLEDGGFRVRALTRNVDSDKAKALAKKGAEVVPADLEDPASIEAAFQGVHGVFGLTSFWDTQSEEGEVRHGKMLVDKAKAAGVKHFVWSTLDHTADPYVSHWNSKAAVDDYLKESGVPRTSLYTSFYYENFFTLPFFQFSKTEGGKLLADWPLLMTDGPIGGYSVAETGAYVLEAFKSPEEWIGNDIRVINDIFTPRELVSALREEIGKEIVVKEVNETTFAANRTLPGVSEDLWANMKWFYIHNGNTNRDFEVTKRILPTRQTLREYIKANKSSFAMFQ